MEKNIYITTSKKGTKVRGEFDNPQDAKAAKKYSTDVITCVITQKD